MKLLNKITQKIHFVNQNIDKSQFYDTLFCLDSQGKGVHNMAINLFDHDPRILRAFMEGFPDSPRFAKYLADCVIRFRGSLFVARILCEALKKFKTEKPVPPECVERLSVEDDISAIGRLNAESRDKIGEIISSNIILGLRLVQHIEVPEGAKDVNDLTIHHPESVDQEILPQISKVFYCACAMLRGCTIDPRAKAA